MKLLSKVRPILALPSDDRNVRIKQGFRNRAHESVSKALYSSIGYWLNKRRGHYLIDYRPDFHYDFNRCPDYALLLQGWLANNRQVNCGDLARFCTIYLNVNQVLDDGIPGDFVELGVYKGNSASLLARLGQG